MYPLLFYSRLCAACNNILADYRQAAAGLVHFVCVDDDLDAVPDVVDRVPALVLPAERVVVVGQDIRLRLQALVAGAGQAAARQEPAETAPAGGEFGESFGFVGSSETPPHSLYAHPFAPQQPPPAAAAAAAREDTGGEKLSDADYSALLARREADVADVLRAQPQP